MPTSEVDYLIDVLKSMEPKRIAEVRRIFEYTVAHIRQSGGEEYVRFLRARIRKNGHEDWRSFAQAIRRAGLPKSSWNYIKYVTVIEWIVGHTDLDEEDAMAVVDQLVKMEMLTRSSEGNIG